MVFLWLYTISKRYPWFLGRFTKDGGERTCITKGSVRKTYFLISMINNILEDGIFMTLWLYTIFKRYPWVLGSFTEDGGERKCITKGSVRKSYFLISMINNILEDGIFMILWLYTIFKRYPWVLGSFTEDGGERQEICLRCRRRHHHTWGTPQIWNHFQCSTKHLRI